MPTSPAARCAIASTTAATRCGGSPSCSCTRKAWSTPLWRTALTLDAVVRARGRRCALGVVGGGSRACAQLVPQVAARHGAARCLDATRPRRDGSGATRAARPEGTAPYLGGAGRRDCCRRRRHHAGAGGTLAFVHAAFWRAGCRRRRGRLHRARARGVGAMRGGPDPPGRRRPDAQLPARRWWHPLTPTVRRGAARPPVVPVERSPRARRSPGRRACGRRHDGGRAAGERRPARTRSRRWLRRVGDRRPRTARHRHPAVPLVGAGHGRGRRGDRRAQSAARS